MSHVYETDYNKIELIYKGKYSLEVKKREYQFTKTELSLLKENITKYDKDEANKLSTFILTAIAFIVSLILMFKEVFANDGDGIYFLGLIGVIAILVLVFDAIRFNLRIKNTHKEKEKSMKEEQKKILELTLKMLVLKNLLLEEDNFQI